MEQIPWGAVAGANLGFCSLVVAPTNLAAASTTQDPRNTLCTHMLTILFHASCVTDSPQAASLAHACMAMAATSASTARKAAEAAGLMSGCRPWQALLDACSRLLRYWAVSAHARA